MRSIFRLFKIALCCSPNVILSIAQVTKNVFVPLAVPNKPKYIAVVLEAFLLFCNYWALDRIYSV